MGQFKELDFLLGKRVRVKNAVKVCYTNKLADVTGTLSFIGENKYLGFKIQATIDRMPVELTNLKQLELIENEK